MSFAIDLIVCERRLDLAVRSSARLLEESLVGRAGECSK